MKLEFIKRDVLKEKPKDESKLGFGRIFTDYMLMMKLCGDRALWQSFPFSRGHCVALFSGSF